ncbi:MAG: hypothetical protein B7Z37_28625 [Verrucomicrobia bacterium 12-59-8]|nr:MAG: hypothetical protein B7Z37_28625 [Verrucomicrobia bacterium 12-59-8]
MNDTTASALVQKDILVSQEEMSFFFKSKKDELGNMVKRDTVKLNVPIPTWDGIVTALNDDDTGKIAQFLVSLVQSEIYLEARSQVNDKEPFTQADLDVAALRLIALATRPVSERKGSAISEDLWKQFEEDYCAVMASALSDKTEKQIKLGAELMVKKFAPVREKKQLIATLRGYLQQWYASTGAKEDLQPIYDYLDSRAQTLLTSEVTPKTFDI